MKPLVSADIDKFVDRFNHFIDAEFRSIEILSNGSIKFTFALQDKTREYDWISLELEFYGVSDAKLLDDTKISFVDMSDGVTFLDIDNKFAFAIGNYNSYSPLKDSICFIVSDSIKYQERTF